MKHSRSLTFIRILLVQLFIVSALLMPVPAFAQTATKNLPDSFKMPGVDPLPTPPPAAAKSSNPFDAAKAQINGAPAQAEEKPILFSKLFDQLPRDIQDQIMAEASTVEADCEGDNTYSYFHDCRCLGAEFIDQRVNHPDTAKATLTFEMRKHCVNEPGIAGYSYNYCMSQFAYMMPKTAGFTDAKRDDYCKCYARTMSKRYADAPEPTHSYISNLQITSLNACLTKNDTPQQPSGGE